MSLAEGAGKVRDEPGRRWSDCAGTGLDAALLAVDR
jgi:hypothetical protein